MYRASEKFKSTVNHLLFSCLILKVQRLRAAGIGLGLGLKLRLSLVFLSTTSISPSILRSKVSLTLKTLSPNRRFINQTAGLPAPRCHRNQNSTYSPSLGLPSSKRHPAICKLSGMIILSQTQRMRTGLSRRIIPQVNTPNSDIRVHIRSNSCLLCHVPSQLRSGGRLHASL